VREESGSLSALTPVLPGQEGQLEAELARLPPGAESPLARVPGTHFGRWLVVPYLQDRRGRPADETSYLLFSSWFDGPVDAYLDTVRESMQSEADAIWGHCVGYPGSDDPGAFAAYLFAHRIKPSYPFAAYREASVEHVRHCLELRQRLIDFAVAHQGSEAGERQRAWRKTFPQRGACSLA
jgi:hypothetical protein